MLHFYKRTTYFYSGHGDREEVQRRGGLTITIANTLTRDACEVQSMGKSGSKCERLFGRPGWIPWAAFLTANLYANRTPLDAEKRGIHRNVNEIA
ncbi:hypothetical protein KIN20_016669 [Parelaphostrongylus tenuis]|uniref:Uncharacterized protein n=1 Tax=Parelaphostrongylus tenuis TaxID=148309 RepID=A0AAD5N5G6_PARTN|nr:hypothetical protein KIN20_016669 [Parelaphostrongylus tenuis]